MRRANLPLIAPPLVREHRLYQADWLLRFYGFKVEELTTPEAPDLPLGMDPKLAWALRHPAQFPVDLHTAPRETLAARAGPRRAECGPDYPGAPLASRDAGGPDAAARAAEKDAAVCDNGGSSTGAGRQSASGSELVVPVRQLELFAPAPNVFAAQG